MDLRATFNFINKILKFRREMAFDNACDECPKTFVKKKTFPLTNCITVETKDMNAFCAKSPFFRRVI